MGDEQLFQYTMHNSRRCNNLRRLIFRCFTPLFSCYRDFYLLFFPTKSNSELLISLLVLNYSTYLPNCNDGPNSCRNSRLGTSALDRCTLLEHYPCCLDCGKDQPRRYFDARQKTDPQRVMEMGKTKLNHTE